MDIDNAAHKIYLPTAEFEEAKPGSRPVAKQGTFMIVVVGRCDVSTARGVYTKHDQ